MSTLTLNSPLVPKENAPRTSWVNPRKFAMWMALAVLTMMFAGFTSAYIVRMAAPNWSRFQLPNNFYYSAAIIFTSSITMALSVRFFKRDNLAGYRLALAATFALGVAFFYSQYLGWKQLEHIGVYVAGNPSGSFVYVITYVHVAHVVGGLICLAIALMRALVSFSNPATFLIFRTDANKKINIELLATYWHFVDVLWIYLLLFFTFS